MTRPLLRGWLHEVAFVLAIPASIVLVVLARAGTDRAAAIVYGIGLCALFGVSASYHRGHWSERAKRWWQRADHGTIFVMIAATYTPICLVLLHGSTGTKLLWAVWIAAGVGLVLALAGISMKYGIGFFLYLAMGWVAAFAMPEIARRASPTEIVLLLSGGLAYTVGAVILAGRWPNPFPRIFGYHELWHSLVIAASACHYVVILAVLRAT
ncbi:MAG TPA: hemolysin III family protein [Acidimicrobiales bacterium]